MSLVSISPELVTAAAGDLSVVGSTIGAANRAAAAPTTQLVAAAGDQISARVATFFGGYGEQYQTFSAQMAAVHQQFVQALNGTAATYGAAEAGNAEQLVAETIDAPAGAVAGHPLIGNGAKAVTRGSGVDSGTSLGNVGGTAPGAAVQTGGWLFGVGRPGATPGVSGVSRCATGRAGGSGGLLRGGAGPVGAVSSGGGAEGRAQLLLDRGPSERRLCRSTPERRSLMVLLLAQD